MKRKEGSLQERSKFMKLLEIKKYRKSHHATDSLFEKLLWLQ
jgi:hypothetical protein